MKVVTIVGARPQFIKAAAISRELRNSHEEILVHTGQHYDYEMSEIFFQGLEIPRPAINLEVGSGSHGSQTGAMLKGVEKALETERPDWVLVYGDTNSTLAGALAAAKLNIPVAHVEAGLRSFNRRMPEEINRVLTDHVSTLLLCPSALAVNNLESEGIIENVHLVGDVMLDVLVWAQERAKPRAKEILDGLQLKARNYVVATVHRSENTDDPKRLAAIVSALNALEETVVFPIHPRARKVIANTGFALKPHVRVIDPLGYFEMLTVTASAHMLLTDSGGLQKEAYWLGVPCVTLREETEWMETVEAGWNFLAGADRDRIISAVQTFSPSPSRAPLYGDGLTARKCVDLLG